MFNEFFVSIGKKLCKAQDTKLPEWFLPETIHKFKFDIIDKESAIKLISLMSCKSNLDVSNMDTNLYVSLVISSHPGWVKYLISLSTVV